jgi:hypothetical protein
MSRYNNQERIGIYEFSLFVTKHFEWICREQSIADVGIDIIIEQSNQGNPTGKLLAFQVKSGDSNFYESENGLTYYVSNIHYNYWLSFDLPVILVLNSIKYNSMFWQIIDKTTLQKTEERWKIIVPTNQKLILESKDDFEAILEANSKFFKIIKKNDRILSDVVSDISYFSFAMNSFTTQFEAILKFELEVHHLAKDLKNNLNNAEKAALLEKVSIVYKTLDRRLKSELPVLIENYNQGLTAYTNLAKFYMVNEIPIDIDKFSVINSIVRQIPNAFNLAIDKITIINKSIYKSINNPILKSAAENLSKTLNILLLEVKDIQDLTEDLIKKLDMIKTP